MENMKNELGKTVDSTPADNAGVSQNGTSDGAGADAQKSVQSYDWKANGGVK